MFPTRSRTNRPVLGVSGIGTDTCVGSARAAIVRRGVADERRSENGTLHHVIEAADARHGCVVAALSDVEHML